MSEYILYPWGTQNARAGNLTVIRHYSAYRKYGYSLKCNLNNKSAMWFKYKRDAVNKIKALINCPNTN